MTRKQNAFTLVEILIVVIILGILAAIVIPQFTSASEDAQAARVETDLQALRTQVQLFKAEIERMPGVDANGDWVAGGQQFIDDLTGTVLNADNDPKGPWLQEFPTNPITGSSTVEAGTDADCTDATNAHGWYFDVSTGKVYAAHNGNL